MLSLEELASFLLPLEPRQSIASSVSAYRDEALAVAAATSETIEDLQAELTTSLVAIYGKSIPSVDRADTKTWRSLGEEPLAQRLKEFDETRGRSKCVSELENQKTRFKANHKALVAAVAEACVAVSVLVLCERDYCWIGMSDADTTDAVESSMAPETLLGEGDAEIVIALERTAFCLAVAHKALIGEEDARLALVLKTHQGVLHLLNGSPSLAYDCFYCVSDTDVVAAASLAGVVLSSGRDPEDAARFASAGLALDVARPELYLLRALAGVARAGPQVKPSVLAATLEDAEVGGGCSQIQAAFRLAPGSPSSAVVRAVAGLRALRLVISSAALVPWSEKLPLLETLRDLGLTRVTCEPCGVTDENSSRRLCHECAWYMFSRLHDGVSASFEVNRMSFSLVLLHNFCFANALRPGSESSLVVTDAYVDELLTFVTRGEAAAEWAEPDATFRGLEWLPPVIKKDCSGRSVPSLDVDRPYAELVKSVRQDDLWWQPMTLAALRDYHLKLLCRLSHWNQLETRRQDLVSADSGLPRDLLAARYFSAVCLATTKDYRGALDEVRWYLAERPLDPEPLALAACCATATGDSSAALSFFRRLLLLCPSSLVVFSLFHAFHRERCVILNSLDVSLERLTLATLPRHSHLLRFVPVVWRLRRRSRPSQE